MSVWSFPRFAGTGHRTRHRHPGVSGRTRRRLPVLAETGVVMPIYGLFADILDYPERSIAKSLGDCIGELTPAIPEAFAQLKNFQNSIADKSLGQLQEVYTNA